MKALFIIMILLVTFIGWVFLPYHSLDSNSYITSPSYEQPEAPISNISSDTYKTDYDTFQCDGRQYCSQMRSYEEAKYFLDHCKDVKMDGDKDGIPCERQFQRY